MSEGADVRELTLKEVREQYGGILPPDAVLRPDDDEIAATAAARQAATRQAARPTPATKPKRRTRSERFAALNAFVDMGMANLTGAEVKVWLILYRDTKANGLARTGQADLARRAGLTTRGVQKVLDKLQAKGLVQVVRRGRLNAGPSVYRVHPMPA
jgi:CRP-like cAMP-binding protein